MKKSVFWNIVGQIRLYSIVDLILLLIAIKADRAEFIGVIFLHLGFLLFLESVHKHKERVPFPRYLWIVLTGIGVYFYHHLAVIGFLVSSFLYAKKNMPSLSAFAPFFRGLQYYFFTSGILGFLNPFAFLSGTLLVLRNFTGDIRDVTKDKKEGLKTLPMVLGFKKSIKHIHLVGLLITSFVWWYIAGISVAWLLGAYLIEIGTYYLTPR